MLSIRRFLYIYQGMVIACLLYYVPVVAQAQEGDNIQRSLVHIELSGTPQSGPNASVAGGVKSQGTGFFVSSDGFILTTRHIFAPLEKQKAVNMEIHARVADPQSVPLKVQFVSDLPTLDLVLLKTNLPFGTEARALELGSSLLIDDTFKEEQKLRTAGFQGDDFARDLALLNERRSSDVPYAWTLKTKTVSGQSGSPVYIKTDTGVKVVGIVKATTRQDDELTLMTPIEFSMPLIGHLKYQELSDRIDSLTSTVESLIAVIGDMGDIEAPLNTRVQDIEGHVAEIESHFTWQAESQSDGSIIVSYEKIISGGLQVDQILVNMTPFMRFFDDTENRGVYTAPAQELRMPDNGQFERNTLNEETGRGEFVIPNVAVSLKSLVDLTARAVGLPEPYRDIEIALIPVVEGQPLSLRKLTVVPEFDWDLVGNNPTIASN